MCNQNKNLAKIQISADFHSFVHLNKVSVPNWNFNNVDYILTRKMSIPNGMEYAGIETIEF